MTVQELIKELKNYDPEREVKVSHIDSSLSNLDIVNIYLPLEMRVDDNHPIILEFV